MPKFLIKDPKFIGPEKSGGLKVNDANDLIEKSKLPSNAQKTAKAVHVDDISPDKKN